MGATAALAAFPVIGLAVHENKKNKKEKAKVEAGAAKQFALMTPPEVPKPPSALDESIQSGAAMNAAAQRVRRQRGGGYSSTLLTGPNGPGQAPTMKKTLLGL